MTPEPRTLRLTLGASLLGSSEGRPRRDGPHSPKETVAAHPHDSEKVYADNALECAVCCGLLDRVGDVCTRCIDAFLTSLQRRRDAASRLAPLESGIVDPWARVIA